VSEESSIKNIAMPSTGDAAADRKTLMRFLYDDVAIKAGLCPNGCGPMNDVEEEYVLKAMNCEHCGFEWRRIC
jgi:hypothetical protein